MCEHVFLSLEHMDKAEINHRIGCLFSFFLFLLFEEPHLYSFIFEVPFALEILLRPQTWTQSSFPVPHKPDRTARQLSTPGVLDAA